MDELQIDGFLSLVEREIRYAGRAALRLTADEATALATCLRSLQERAEQAEMALARICEWREDADGNWDSACGETWTMIDGTPTENHYRFCPSCGGQILHVSWVEPQAEIDG